ncbi:PDC sensor domain-containing protein [Reichenbachiella agariperforans]|uniref:PDC sensor domain-containing protein n=1 Tax=Reichenbachiella agariperforans TaxID=156994 RepID=UPI001C0956B5|nr:cache domain-containing protein [Reichenbachiella agariperforans]MBU2916003.1 Cache 3/Cache 2 fusion domain-containing protein [Reichenbachiella agariperforans]
MSNIVFQRSTYIMVAVFSLILVTWLLTDLYFYTQEREKESVKIGFESNEQITHSLDSVLRQVAEVTHGIKGLLETYDLTKDQLVEVIEGESRAFEFILGITVAYEPYQFSDSIPLYAPYYDKRQNTLIDIADVYDYTDSTLSTAQWYTKVVELDSGLWSEPYFAQGAQQIVSDFGVPMYGVRDGEQVIVGTVTLTIALESLNKALNSISIGNTGYSFLASTKGTIIAHPTPKYILNVSLQDMGEVFDIPKLSPTILEQDSGYLEYKSLYTETDSYLFFETLPTSGWKCMVVFATNDLLGSPVKLGNKIVNISLAGSFLVLMWLAVFIRISRSSNQKFWIISTITSVLILINIAVVWYLNIKMGYAADDNSSVKIMNQTELFRYVLDENTRMMQLGYDPYMTISTGIFVEEIAIRDSYSLSVKGRVWQKWPIGLDEEFEPDFAFVQESPIWGTRKELISKTTNEETGENYYLWQFSATIKLALKYSKYPFDSRDINIELAYPDFQSKIWLTPDLEGYKVLNPSAFPGINRDIYFPKAVLESTFFSFERLNYQTSFGNPVFKGDDEYPVMEFNVSLKRRFLNAFVINIIPIFVVASMIFLIFYSNSKRKDSNTGVSMMGVVQSCAGFFFVLLVAHIDLRRRLSTPEISYMETFYFTMYIMIGLLAVNVVAFAKAKDTNLLAYEDNLIVKLAYWPLLLGSWLVITLATFYN